MALETVVRPLAYSLGLQKLPEHFSVILASFASFTVLHAFVAPAIWRLSGIEATWKKNQSGRVKSVRKERGQWSTHLVSLVHASIIIPLSFRALDDPDLNADRAFGWDKEGKAGLVTSVAVGYFLWDSIESIVNFVDVGFIAHGVACLAIYLLAFSPFLAYYSARFLFWELSTPFLNIHWFLDRAGYTGSTIQLINGLFLLTTFFGARLIYGSIMSWRFYKTLYAVRGEITLVFTLVYGLGNVLLNGLNWFWFYKMIKALRKRFDAGAEDTAKSAETSSVMNQGVGNGSEAPAVDGVRRLQKRR